MNQFFTEVEIKDLGWKINHREKLMMVGSCFTENIGQLMQRLKFQVDLNPFGILYNPQSIAKSLRLLTEQKQYTVDDLFEHQGVWHSFDHHSRFSSTDPKQALTQINAQILHSSAHLKESKYLILSFGTAWVFELKRTGEIVSNCHKLPASEFKRLRLTPGEIVEKFKDLIASLLKFNPNLRILFTVSPIRHWKDGAVENSLSKATLLLAVNRLITGFSEDICGYFPSYEIVMDELRDYRFYAADMLHIGDQAVNHIWQKFNSKMVSDESHGIIKSVLKVVKAREHRPLNRNSESYEKFLLYNLKEIKDLLENFPFLNLEKEKRHFELELNGCQRKRME